MNNIYDAFGTLVQKGDWIYFMIPNISTSNIYIGKIFNFNSGNQPLVRHFTNDYKFQTEDIFFNSRNIVTTKFIKCYNQPLIETLEALKSKMSNEKHI